MTRPFSTACELHGQPFFPVDPVHPLPIHDPAFAAKHDVQAEIAKARAGLGPAPAAACEPPYRPAHAVVIHDARFNRSSPHARRTPIAN